MLTGVSSLVTVSPASSELKHYDFIDLLKQLKEAEKRSEGRIVVDLSGIRFAYPDGMVPLITVIRSMVSRGRAVAVRPPSNDLSEFFDIAGWTSAIEATNPPRHRRGSSYVPLTPYLNYAELNTAVNDAMDVITELTVFPTGVREAIEWCLNEVADNVLNHAASADPGWIQVQLFPNGKKLAFVVTDSGRGIRASLSEGYPEIASDEEALAKAIQKGITRNQQVGQGNGLSGLVRIANCAGGFVRIHSGQAMVTEQDGRLVGPIRQEGYRGTCVIVTLPADAPIDLNDALWGTAPDVAYDFSFIGDDGITFRLADETENFGNRYTARLLRNKVSNLMSANPELPVVIDFGDVPMITASFADEFIGKLALELGAFSYFRRFRFVAVTQFIERTLNEVLRQRLSG